MKLSATAKTVEDGVHETLNHNMFPRKHWQNTRTNNSMERINIEIRRRTHVSGNFPDGRSALMLVTTRFRYIGRKQWGTHRYMVLYRLGELVNYQVLGA